MSRLRQVELICGRAAQCVAGNNFEDAAADPALVSVVVPSYNHAPYVAQAIESIGAQTYAKMEIIVIDDDSSDDTFELTLSALKRQPFPFVSIKRSRHHGGVPNLNAGIQLAYGGWIAMLASDDLFYPAKTAIQVAAGETASADVVIGLVDEIHKDGRLKSRRNFGTDNAFAADASDRLRMVIENHFSVMTQGMLFRRSVFATVGLFTPEIFTEDFDFIARLLVLKADLAFVPEPVAQHRVTRSQLTLDHVNRMRDASMAVVRRHARSHLAFRRGGSTIYYESSFNKLANGYFLAAMTDLARGMALAPAQFTKLAGRRLFGRLRRSR